MQKTPTHEDVSRAYTRAVETPSPSSGCCGGTPEQKGVAVRSAGYADDELAALPQDAVVNAFGCGNPLAFSAVKEGDVVLDLGSGAGIDLLLAARKVGPTGRVIGVDMTDAMIARARENVERGGAAWVEVRKGLIEALPEAGRRDPGCIDAREGVQRHGGGPQAGIAPRRPSGLPSASAFEHLCIRA